MQPPGPSQAAGLEDLLVRPLRDGQHFSLRWMLLHLTEETARYAGHADFLREAIDGRSRRVAQPDRPHRRSSTSRSRDNVAGSPFTCAGRLAHVHVLAVPSEEAPSNRMQSEQTAWTGPGVGNAVITAGDTRQVGVN